MASVLELLQQHLKDLLYISGAVLSFFAGSKLRKVNLDKEAVYITHGELENVEAALKIYRLMLTDLQVQLKKAEEAYLVIEQRLHKSLEIRKALTEENIKLKIELDEIRGNSKQI